MPKVDQETSYGLSFDRHDLAQIVRACVAEASVASPSVPVEVSCPQILPAVIHKEAFTGAVRILVDAACRHTDEGLSTTVKAIRGAEGISVHVIQRGSADGEDADLELPRALVALHGGILWSEPLPAGGIRVSFVIPDDPPALEGEELEAALAALEQLAQERSEAATDAPRDEEAVDAPVVGLELLDDAEDQAPAEVILDVTDFRELVERDEERAEEALPDVPEPAPVETAPEVPADEPVEPAAEAAPPELVQPEPVQTEDEAAEAEESAPPAIEAEPVHAVPEPPPPTPAEPPDPPAAEAEGDPDLLAAFEAGFDAVAELAARVEHHEASEIELDPEPADEEDQAAHQEQAEVEALQAEPVLSEEVSPPKQKRGWRRWRRTRRGSGVPVTAEEAEGSSLEEEPEPAEVDEAHVDGIEAPVQSDVFGPPDPPAFLELDAEPGAETDAATVAEVHAEDEAGGPVDEPHEPPSEPEPPAASEPEPQPEPQVEATVPEIEKLDAVDLDAVQPEVEEPKVEESLVEEPEVVESEVVESEPESEPEVAAFVEPEVIEPEVETAPEPEVAEPEVEAAPEVSEPEVALEPEVVEPEVEAVPAPEPVSVPDIVAEVPESAEPESLPEPATDPEPVVAAAEEQPSMEAPTPPKASPRVRKPSRSKPRRRARRWMRSRATREAMDLGVEQRAEPAQFFVSAETLDEQAPQPEPPPPVEVPAASIPIPDPEPEVAASTVAPARPPVREQPKRFVPDPLHPATQMLHSLVLEYEEDLR